MNYNSFIEGPLLRAVFATVFVLFLVRIILFVMATQRNQTLKGVGIRGPLTIIGRFLIPYHKVFFRRPFYTGIRYLFHVFLVLVPLFFSYHIFLWETSWFGWRWLSFPDHWIDWMTMALLLISVYFIIRRLVNPTLRRHSTRTDYFLLILIILVFLTGYVMTHNTFDLMEKAGDFLFALHVLGAEVLLLAAVFLLWRPKLYEEVCTGCASCEANCPTGTLKSYDGKGQRSFFCSPYQCIFCGSCLVNCPERAVELKHEISLRGFFRIISKSWLRQVELFPCHQCGHPFAPVPQVERLARDLDQTSPPLCPRCKLMAFSFAFRRRSPLPTGSNDAFGKYKITPEKIPSFNRKPAP